MPSDELGWRHYSGFAPCIITQTNVLGRPGGGKYCASLMSTFILANKNLIVISENSFFSVQQNSI